MPNAKYLRGVRLERYLVKLGKEHGWSCARTAGSHGFVDVIWWRMCGLGSVQEAWEHIKGAGWLPTPDLSTVPGPFLYIFFRFTRGTNKQYVWALPVADGYSQCVLWQCKTKRGKKKRGEP
jgi:hypothetical protein